MQFRSIESSFVWLHRVLDLCIPASILYLITINYGLQWNAHYQNAAILTSLIVLIINQYIGLYQNWRGRSLFESSQILVKSWILVWALLIIMAFIFKASAEYSRVVLISWSLITPIILISYRYLIRTSLTHFNRKGIFVKSIAMYGSSDTCKKLIDNFEHNRWLGYKVVGVYDDNADKTTSINIDGGLTELLKIIDEDLIQTLYIVLPARREPEVKELLDKLADTTITVKYIPDFSNFNLLHASISNITGLPELSIYDTPLRDPGKAAMKRLEDILLSAIILIIISPTLLAVSIGVKLTSPGPIFFRQSRIGWNGKEFTIFKFRSMPVAKQQIQKPVEIDGDLQDNPNEYVATRFGAFIRKYSIDELPQFINVLKGNMSIVGPRPERSTHVPVLRKQIPRYMQKHMVKAGITGWAQINGWRGDTSLEKRIEYDLEYINQWSIWLDIKIIFLTIVNGFINKSE